MRPMDAPDLILRSDLHREFHAVQSRIRIRKNTHDVIEWGKACRSSWPMEQREILEKDAAIAWRTTLLRNDDNNVVARGLAEIYDSAQMRNAA